MKIISAFINLSKEEYLFNRDLYEIEKGVSFSDREVFEYRNFVLLFEGDIYNRKSLCKEIVKRGIVLLTKSDSEIFIKGFSLFKNSFLNMTEGKFTAFLYDRYEKKLYIFRDKVGLNSLFYYRKENFFLFSNRLKDFYQYPFFDKKIDYNSLALYLKHGYIMQPHTIFKNCYKVKTGCYLVLDLKSRKMQEKKYWDIAKLYAKEKIDISHEEAINEAETLLENAVAKRMKKNENIGSFLSGGYDSTTVATFLQLKSRKKIDTFTVGFDHKSFNETSFAKQSAAFLETNHHEIYCDDKRALEIVPTIFDYYDEPFFDCAAIATIEIKNEAVYSNTDSIFAGEGGDEVFLNAQNVDLYTKFFKIPFNQRIFLADFLKKIKMDKMPYIKDLYNFSAKYQKFISMLNSRSISKMFDIQTALVPPSLIESLLKKEHKEIPTFFDENFSDLCITLENEAMTTYFKSFLLDDGFVKVNQAFFDTQIMVRYPYLDEKLITFLTSLDVSLKQAMGIKKYLLKEILHKYIPKDLMQRPKQSFSVPIEKWGRRALRDLVLDCLSEERIKRENIFDYKTVEKLKKDYFENGKNESFQPLWLIVIFELWYESFMSSTETFYYEKVLKPEMI